MRRRRRQNKRWIPLTLVFLLGGGGAWYWYGWRAAPAEPSADDPNASTLVGHEEPLKDDAESVPELSLSDVSADEDTAPTPAPQPFEIDTPAEHEAQLSANEPLESEREQNTAETSGERYSDNPRINASLQRYHGGDVLGARRELNRMLQISRDDAEQAELRRHLATIADATIFSRSGPANDPLIEQYTLQSGDYLSRIAPKFKVPHEVIMMVNGIQDAARIRAGQRLRIPHGPFHARVDLSAFRLDVYLQDTFVRSFPVGLGKEPGTPTGEWKVKDRLTNPTYYPSASSDIKRIIPGDDPENPLGERWIGMEGVAGNAVGHEGYGIHGTIEPESIGRSVSLGCIRMHNDDVAFVYKLLSPNGSKVTTTP